MQICIIRGFALSQGLHGMITAHTSTHKRTISPTVVDLTSQTYSGAYDAAITYSDVPKHTLTYFRRLAEHIGIKGANAVYNAGHRRGMYDRQRH